MSNVRNTRTTHPAKSARRERVLSRIRPETKAGNSNAREIAALAGRVGKPPRSWSEVY